jgi:hypothetical protein
VSHLHSSIFAAVRPSPASALSLWQICKGAGGSFQFSKPLHQLEQPPPNSAEQTPQHPTATPKRRRRASQELSQNKVEPPADVRTPRRRPGTAKTDHSQQKVDELSLAKMLSRVNALEIIDIQEEKTDAG